MKALKKALRIGLIIIAALILLFGLVILTRPKNPHLHVSRSEAIATALSHAAFTRHDVKNLKTELEFDGSGGYPCYYIFFSYQDEDGLEVRVRCAVDGETGEYLGLERVE